jgi:hypothetical protein
MAAIVSKKNTPHSNSTAYPLKKSSKKNPETRVKAYEDFVIFFKRRGEHS